MSSTFMGLEIGKRGLSSHQQALQVTGHNISNAENKEYSRQRVVITSADPIYEPAFNRAERAGQIGQGSTVARIERIRDAFVDDRIVTEKNSLGYWQTKDKYVYQIENIYNEPSDNSIRTKSDEFWKSWQELSKYPEQRSTREVVKEKGVALSNEINHVSRQLLDLQRDANREVALRVEQINEYGTTIRDLNMRILKAESLGDSPNDLLDRRDALIEKLSQLVDVSVGRSDEDELIVYIGSENFVQGEVLHKIAVKEDPDNQSFYKVVWQKTEADVTLKSGELQALLDVRDKVLQQNIDDIDSMAMNMMDLTNEVHRDGFGKNGRTNIDFFRTISLSENIEGNADLNNDGEDDVSAIFKVAGKNRIDASAAIGINGTLLFRKNDGTETLLPVDYVSTDTANSVIQKINNAKLGVVAYMTHDGNFALKATAALDNPSRNFMIRHLEDSGQFLVGLTGVLQNSGPDGAYEYTELNAVRNLAPEGDHITLTPRKNPSVYMAVSKEIIDDVDNIASAQGIDSDGSGDYNLSNGVGDGQNALAIASIRHKNAMVQTSSTFDDFYISLISRIGSEGEESRDRVNNQEILLSNLGNLRESISGINLDEEMANMVAFQHGYNASARMISTFDKMLETIIGLGGR
ncbi:MAG: flagellar hook-associated protein FlgK [Spirochaetes bacterium]|nr:flagellar hook-associated protein FlgK [Spirochaetota bacterium]MBN2769668.1 flagellar hook-associated protein FlgK [Spirochaetota bacterium]